MISNIKYNTIENTTQIFCILRKKNNSAYLSFNASNIVNSIRNINEIFWTVI